MASLSFPAPKLQQCIPYCTTDPVLGPIVVFYNPQSSLSQSRVEAHILTCAGFQSYPRLQLSDSSPLYAAVNHLPPHFQNCEVRGALAVSVLKYFQELSKPLKEVLKSKSYASGTGEGQAVAFDEMHAGDLAARLKEVESESLASNLESALTERFLSSVDIDIVLRTADASDVNSDEIPPKMEEMLGLFGEPTHLPFTKLKRAPSKPASTMNRPNLSADNTESLNRELEELRHTEENYVAKLLDLLENVAKPLKQQARLKKGDHSSPTVRELDALFPPSLEQIINVNSAFLDDIEHGGLEDISKCCLKHFPDFKKPYEDYLRASADFPLLLNKFTKDRHSSFSKKVQQTGEQKLRSLIIEPVQRLPRYSLLIDNMISCLSPEDPSLGPLNDARDVITDICSLQTSEKEERTATTRRLQNLILSWPPQLRPTGRLITAVDFYEILPPYDYATSDAIPSILLLFPDCIAILRRPSKTSISARGVMAEVDRPAGAGGGFGSNSGSGSKREALGHDLQFAGWVDIGDVRISSSDFGINVWMTLVSNLRDSWDMRQSSMGVRKMQLANAYEGRATKFEEEFAKARLERRIAGGTRGIVGVREAKVEGLTVWCCVWGSQLRYASRTKKGSTVVYLDEGGGLPKHGKDLTAFVGKDGVDVAISIEPAKDDKVRLDYRSWNDFSAHDTLSREEAFSGFAKRLYSLLRQQTSPQHPPLTAALMSGNRKLLKSLGIPFEGDGKQGKLRPPSPGKIFQSFRTAGGPERPGTAPGTPQRATRQLILDRGPILTPSGSPERPAYSLQRGATVLGLMEEEPIKDDKQKIMMAVDNPLRKLEATFESFVHALKTMTEAGADLLPLRDLSTVDELEMKMLLAQMVEDPMETQIPPRTGIQVVFLAFSRFLREHWKDSMGEICPESTLAELQERSDTLFAGDFEDYFKNLILEWTPQNKRAFRTIVLMLEELQSQMTEDDQKGILTQAFTGLVVGEALNPLEYIGLMDRLVGDSGILFNEAPPPSASPSLSLVSGLERAGAVRRAKSNSITSVSLASTSSLRKRFGISSTGSLREAGKTSDREFSPEPAKNPSVWRTLSKNSRESVRDSWKGHIARSKSTDIDTRTGSPVSLRRPNSSERPTVLGSNAFNTLTPAKPLRPMATIMQSPNLSEGALAARKTPPSIGPSPPNVPGLRRAKRRSSLSDITAQQGYTPANNPVDLDITPPASPAASAPSMPHPLPAPPTPDSEGHMLDIRPLDMSKARSFERPLPSPGSPPKLMRASPLSSGSPSPTPTRDSRSGSVHREERDLPRKYGSIGMTGQRLKMQNPQKLQKRLQHDHEAISKAEASLLSEIDKIGEELNNALKPQRSSYQTTRAMKDLTARLGGVEAKFEERERETAKIDVLRRESERALQKKEREVEEANEGWRAAEAAATKRAEEAQQASEQRRAAEETLRIKEKEMQTKEKEMQTKEKEMQTKEKEMQTKEKEMQTKEKEMQTKEKEMQIYEKEMQTKEKEMQIKEKEMRIKEREMQIKEKEMQTLRELFNDCQEENDVMFEKFNEELGKIAASFRQGKAEKELMESLQDAKSDQARLKRENMKLRKDNNALRVRMDSSPLPG